MVCHWDLVGVMGPRDPNTPKRAWKKLVISVDDLEESGNEAPSPATDLAASAFAVQNAANVLVTELAAVQATFIQFQDTLAGSLNRLTDRVPGEGTGRGAGGSSCSSGLASTTHMGGGAPSRQMEIVLVMAAGNAEAGPSEEVVGLIRQARTSLFLLSDKNMEPSDESYINEAKGSGSEEGSEDENEDVEENVREDVDEDVEEADEMDVDQTLRD
jgi:hypothetical protein